ncbi:hypothetical protein DRW42_05270 [Pedobacter miscanthi]|uniref:Uncharacterized protein n=1 Tax=Pedobacter miscanthi TaxID=2259170 RepID=A0A366L971_9SPHI|nr:hypothetical protein DRW42_05270 [Pedobacter miscanthi]
MGFFRLLVGVTPTNENEPEPKHKSNSFGKQVQKQIFKSVPAILTANGVCAFPFCLALNQPTR